MIRRFIDSPARFIAAPIFAVSIALAGSACDPGEEPEDAGNDPEPVVDAGGEPEDGGAPVDAGGGEPDAGQPEDAGPIDAGGEPEDGGLPIDGGEPEPVPEPVVDVVRVEGQVKRVDYVDAYYQADAEIIAKNIGVVLTSNPSAVTTGDWYLDGIPAATNLKITVRYGGGSAAYQTQQAKFIPATDAIYTYDPYVAPPTWLEEVAVACGATFTLGVGGAPSTDFLTTATIIGTFKDVDGNPVAGITKANVQVEMQGPAGAYVNNDPAKICFLQNDGAVPAKYKGGDYAATDATGKYVIFGVKNAAAGTGIGLATLAATYNGATFTSYLEVSSGVVYMDAYAQDVVPVIDQLIDFETQIIPLLQTAQCAACHTAGGVGAVDRGGYLAIFDGAASDIYDNIVGPGTVCAPGSTYRICGNTPLDSYMITKPLLDLDGQANHPNETWFSVDEPEVVLLRTWIEQGYPRYAVPPDPVPVNATFADVMAIFGPSADNAGGVNCVNCHGYNTGYSANLSLDGCIDDAAIQAEYTAANVDYDPVANPDYYNEDCAYYHVALQQSNHYINGGSAYYVDAANNYSRVNTNNPGASLIYQKPRCNPGTCAVVGQELVHSGNPNIPTFFAPDVYPATVLIDWVDNGSAYSRVGGPNDGT